MVLIKAKCSRSFKVKLEDFNRLQLIFVRKGRKCDNEMWSMTGYFQIIKDVKIGSRWIKFNMSHINQ